MEPRMNCKRYFFDWCNYFYQIQQRSGNIVLRTIKESPQSTTIKYVSKYEQNKEITNCWVYSYSQEFKTQFIKEILNFATGKLLKACNSVSYWSVRHEIRYKYKEMLIQEKFRNRDSALQHNLQHKFSIRIKKSEGTLLLYAGYIVARLITN